MTVNRVPIPRAAVVRNVVSTNDTADQIEEVTYTGLQSGMFPGLPVHEIPDSGARIIQDAFVHNPGLVVRRGPVQGVSGLPQPSYPACGMASVVDPQGNVRVGVFNGDSSHGYLSVWSSDWTTLVNLSLGVDLPSGPFRAVQIGPRLDGGVYISIQDKFAMGSSQSLILWRGGMSATYSAGTVTTNAGSTAVTGSGTSWRANVTPGMFLFAGGKYVGVVKTVNNDGSLTLEDVALVWESGASYTLQPFRGINPRVGKGYITTDTTSTTVNGANTKFQADGIGTSGWDIYRASDFTYIGTVASIVSDIQLTLGANATLNLDQEAYVAINNAGTYPIAPATIGAITSIWAGRQAYANNGSDMPSTSQIWFSSVDDPEALDQATTDGDYITVPSIGPSGVATPIVAMAPTPVSLLILKDSETYALYGATTAQFQIAPISTDGCLSPMSVQTWNGLVLFAGRQGIYMFDGQEAVNITSENLGWWYQECVQGFDPTQYRMWSMISHDHYFLFMERVTPPIPILKGTESFNQTMLTIAIHLPTQAVVTHENVNIRGSVQLPSQSQRGTWYVVNNASGNGTVCAADDLFDSDGNDSFGSDGLSVGPDFYLETKKYTLGDALLKKLWKMLLMTYMVVGDAIKMDTVPGFNEIGTTANSDFPASGLTWSQVRGQDIVWNDLSGTYPTWDSPTASQFVTKRVKFLKRSQAMSFRFWQNSSSIKSLTLGPWSLVVKPQRIGRV